MALTPEQLKELEELEELDALEQMQQSPINMETEDPTTVEALSAGFVEGVPFLKDAVAGYEAIKDTVTSEDPINLDAAIDRYRTNMEDINDTINLAQEKAPIATTIGDIAGNIAIAPGASSLKAISALGAASELSRSEDRGVEDVVKGAGLGAAGQMIGKGIGKVIKKPIASIGNYLESKADEAIQAAIGSDRAFGASRIYKHLKRTGQSKDEFVTSIKGMNLISAGDDTTNILNKAQNLKNNVGKELGNYYKAVDDEFKPEINVKELKQRLKDDIIPEFADSDDPGMREIGASLASYIDDLGKRQTNIKSVLKPSGQVDPAGAPIMVEEITKDIVEDEFFSLSRTHGLQKDIRSRIQSIFKANGADATVAKEQQRRVAASLGNVIDETLDTVSTPENPVFSKVKEVRQKFGNLATVEEILENKLSKTKADPVSDLKQVVGFRSIFLTGLGSSIGGVPGAAAGFAINKIMNDPRTPTYIAQGIGPLAKRITGDPTSKIAQRVIMAATMSDTKFKNALEASIAETKLEFSPIERNTTSVKQHSKDLERLLQYHMPSQKKVFNDLLDENDDEGLAQFIDQLSKSKEASKFFAPGIGVNNKVFSPEDKAQLEKQVNQENIPAVERIRLLKDLRSNGNIPDMSSVMQRQPKKYVPKVNKEPKY